MTNQTRRGPRLYGTWLALLAAAVFAFAACTGTGSNGGASFGPGDDGSGSDVMDTGGTGY